MTMNSSSLETVRDSSPRVTTSSIVPIAADPFPEKPYSIIEVAFNSATVRPIFSKVDRNRRFTNLPLSTNTLLTFRLASWTATTKGSL